MNKIIELLKSDLKDILRRPANVAITFVMVFGILLLTGFVLNEGATSEIIASYSVFIAAYVGFIITAMGIPSDRESGLYRMYRSSKLSKKSYVTARTAYSIIGLFLALLVIAVGVPTAQINLHWLVLPVLMLSILSHIGIGLLIPAFVERTQEAQRVSQIIFFAMIFLAPVFYTSEKLPEIVQLSQQFVPLTHAVEAMRTITVDSGGLTETIYPLSLLTALTVLAFTAGYRKLDY